MVEREGQVVHHPVGMVVGVRPDLRPHAEALQAQVVVGADGALDAGDMGQVLGAVVAVVEAPMEGSKGLGFG